jgi:DNA-binding transcriptional regulator YbjK
MPNKDTKFTKENAREMQARGTKVRKENTARRKAVAHVLADLLSKPVSEGSKVTKLEWLVARAIDNTRDDVGLSDLLKIQELLGEKQMTFNFEKRNPSEVARDILDEIGE